MTAATEWPHHSNVMRRCASWPTVISAAVKVAQEPLRWSVGSRPPQRRFSRADCVRSNPAPQTRDRDWPDGREYTLCHRVEGELCRRAGALERFPPNRSAVRKRLRTWPDALELARRQSGVASTDA